jgi:hypothetical protein
MTANRYRLRQKEYVKSLEQRCKKEVEQNAYKELYCKISPTRDRTPQGRAHQAEQPVQVHARQGQVGHQGIIYLVSWLAESGHGRDSHLHDTQPQEDLHLAFAGTDSGNTHGNLKVVGGLRLRLTRAYHLLSSTSFLTIQDHFYENE